MTWDSASAMSRPLRVLLALIGLAIMAPPANAQGHVDVEPVIGAYWGLTSFDSPDGAFPEQSVPLSQRTAVALGLQATWWSGHDFGIRAYAASSSSSVGPADRDFFGSSDPESARITVFGAELLLPVYELETGTTVFLAGGGGVIRRSGDAYEGHEGTSDIAGTLGLGSLFPISRRVSLEGDARVLLYQLALRDALGASYGAGTQADILAHVGVVFHLGTGTGD